MRIRRLLGAPYRTRTLKTAVAFNPTISPMSKYEDWTREQLLERIAALETNQEEPKDARKKFQMKKKKEDKAFNIQDYAHHKIALKFCYNGWEYNGLAFQSEVTPLPTVEGVLFDALCKTRLIDRDAGFEGCDWARCGRTDRGVSSAGQVVSIRMRSSTRPRKPTEGSTEESGSTATEFYPDIRYVQVLNQILPPSIRVLAWCPVKPDFSARFNCRSRHYKYFFESLHPPAAPLDISRMQEAASRFVGEHDFRNFCKLDGAKQIQSHCRRVKSVSISQTNHPTPQGEQPLYVLDLVGSAFLWHQVRHMMAVLFLVGQRLEEVDIVDAMLNVTHNNPNVPPTLPVLEGRPIYEMSAALPLMLWQCGFDEEDIQWRTDDYDGKGPVPPTSSASTVHLLESMQTTLASTAIKAQLQQHFFQEALKHHQTTVSDHVVRVQSGAGLMRHMAQYTPLLKRKRGPTPDEVNEMWRNGRGLVYLAKRAKGKTVGSTSSTPLASEATIDDGVIGLSDITCKS